jgi:hypothetical protein
MAVTTEPQEFEFIPGQPKYGKLVVKCLNRHTYAHLKGYLCRSSSSRRFNEVSFKDSTMEISFQNAAVTNMGHGYIDIREGTPGFNGSVNFHAADKVLINGLRLRTADLDRRP